MSPRIDLTISLPKLGELLAKLKKDGRLSKPPTLKAILKAHGLKDSRMAKEALLGGMRRVFPGDHEAETKFDEIFHRGKAHPSAEALFIEGSNLGMMWLAGLRTGWPDLKEIMVKYHVTRPIAKEHMMPGFTAILGEEEGEIAWDRIFPRVQNADMILLEGRGLGWQQKMGTLHDPKTLLRYTHELGATNTGTVRDLFIEAMTDMFGEEAGEDLYAEIFPHALNPKIIALLHLEGHQLAKLWRHGRIVNYPTLTDYMRLYEIQGRDIVRRYVLEGMSEVLEEKEISESYSEIFSQKSNLSEQKIEELREIGHELGEQWREGRRTTSYIITKLMYDKGIGDIRTVERHILAGLEDVLGEEVAEIALETYFSNVHPNAAAILQYATGLAYQVDAGTVKEYKTLRELSVQYNASEETTSKYVYEAFILEFGEKKGHKLYEKAFPHDLHAPLGVYNHPILEDGLREVITGNFEEAEHTPVIKTEKLEGNVKHDVLIEYIHEGGWFQKQLERETPQHNTFQEALKLTDAAAGQYLRVSGDFSTWDEPGRVEEKDEKYGDEHTLFLMVLTKYNETDKYIVRIPANRPNARVISAEMFFLLCGAKTPALELVRKVRDLTRQGKVEELRKWKQKVDIGTAPSFLTGQQTLDEWLEAESEAGEAAEEEGDPDEKEEEKDKGKATGEKQPEKAREKGEEEPERASVGQEPASNNKNELQRTEQVHDGDRQGERNLKIGPGK